MSEHLPSKDHDPMQDAKRMAQGLHQWVWPRKPLAPPKGAKGTPLRTTGRVKTKPMRRTRATASHPMPGWD